MHPEHLICKSISGNMVRSKSEMMIDMLLFQHRIPFRYECALVLVWRIDTGGLQKNQKWKKSGAVEKEQPSTFLHILIIKET